jgi:hypothetical protein
MKAGRRPVRKILEFFRHGDWMGIMKIPFRILLLISVLLWLSAFTMFAMGMLMHGASVFRLAAIPEAVMALIFTALAAQKWSGGS